MARGRVAKVLHGVKLEGHGEEMARFYVEEVVNYQPEGPYCLGGYSMGAFVAFEMACQMAKAGREVIKLALIDDGPAHYPQMSRRKRTRIGAALSNVNRWMSFQCKRASARLLIKDVWKLARMACGKSDRRHPLLAIPDEKREVNCALSLANICELHERLLLDLLFKRQYQLAAECMRFRMEIMRGRAVSHLLAPLVFEGKPWLVGQSFVRFEGLPNHQRRTINGVIRMRLGQLY